MPTTASATFGAAASNPVSPSQANERLRADVIAANTAAFALAFAAWVMFGPSVRTISTELHVDPSWANLIKAIPILMGSACRIPVGMLTDRLGARLMFPAVLLVGAATMAFVSLATTLSAVLIGGFVLGLVGTTFAIGVQSTSSWTPKSRQGFAMGIFGAGNVGTALTTFGMPWLLLAVGWRATFQIYAAIIALTAAAYWFVVRDVIRTGARPPLAALLMPLKDIIAWKLGLYYMATFGVFVAATLMLSDLYVDAYGVAATTAGALATTFTFTASLCRIPGGYLADRCGARGVSGLALVVATAALLLATFDLSLAGAVSTVFIAAIALGIGMAAVMKFVPDYFPTTVGAVGGIVGALGGLVAFFLPLLGGALKASYGSASVQFVPLAVLAGTALIVFAITERQARSAAARTVGAGGAWPSTSTAASR